jgi:hypothetical protein
VQPFFAFVLHFYDYQLKVAGCPQFEEEGASLIRRPDWQVVHRHGQADAELN